MNIDYKKIDRENEERREKQKHINKWTVQHQGQIFSDVAKLFHMVEYDFNQNYDDIIYDNGMMIIIPCKEFDLLDTLSEQKIIFKIKNIVNYHIHEAFLNYIIKMDEFLNTMTPNKDNKYRNIYIKYNKESKRDIDNVLKDDDILYNINLLKKLFGEKLPNEKMTGILKICNYTELFYYGMFTLRILIKL